MPTDRSFRAAFLVFSLLITLAGSGVFATTSHAVAPVVSNGDNHTCVLAATGIVRCWGLNNYGQLGNGSLTNSSVPVTVSGLGVTSTSVTSGGKHACSLDSGGAVQCWGSNAYGQLGDSSTTTRTTPVAVSGLGSGVAQISAGDGHTCAVTTAGEAKCWGRNDSGQLGNGSTSNSSVPVTVSTLGSGVAWISAGDDHTCAVTTAGAAKCWGYNISGQLGNDNTTSSSAPVSVYGLSSGVQQISAGRNSSCAVTTGGGAKCWGMDANGQLGNNVTSASSSRPVDVLGFTSGTAKIAVGDSYACLVTTAGAAHCWGYNSYRTLGGASSDDSWVPVAVVGAASGVDQIAVGGIHTCALTAAGMVDCWGSNTYGQLGYESSSAISLPTEIAQLPSTIAHVATGSNHACAITTSGTAKCWGDNLDGQLGNNSTNDSPDPVDVIGLGQSLTRITAGGGQSCGLTDTGGLKCWGDNPYGQLGNGTTVDSGTPVDVSTLTSGVSYVEAGLGLTCAVTSTGAAKCWGDNGYGQLGDGSTTRSSTPVTVSGLSTGVAQIAAGAFHACALTTAGAVQCWGNNSFGQLGNSSTSASYIPVAVTGLSSGVIQIEVGGTHTCALMSDGTVKCWGFNSRGQLGIGTLTASNAPVAVPLAGSGNTKLSMGYWHTCLLTGSGGAKCWGGNDMGQLGDGTLTNRTTPVDVTGATGGISEISAGYSFTCALTTVPKVKCWGSNTNGQIAIEPPNWTASTVPSLDLQSSDATPPTTSITTAPPVSSNVTSATFEFESSEPSTYRCALDAAPLSACNSPATYDNLASGSHTLTVVATDAAGNPDPTPATHSWTIDLGLPNTTITGNPSNPTSSSDATFTFVSSKAGSTFLCSLDGATFASCSSPMSVSSLPAGSHTMQVKAVDASGNTELSPASFSWTIDLTPPDTFLFLSPAPQGNSASASFTFQSSEFGSNFKCSLDGSSFTTCFGSATYSGLAEGSHSFAVAATDAVGNVDASPVNYTWVVDLTAPDTTIVERPASSSTSSTASFTFSSSEPGASFQCSLDGGGFASCPTPNSITGLAAGGHSISVMAVDAAGNADATPAFYDWSVTAGVASQLALTVPTAMKYKKPLSLTASCPDACKLTLRLKVGKKSVALPVQKVAAGSASRLVLKLNKKAKKLVKAALRKKKKVKLKLVLTAASGASVTKAVAVKK